MTLRIAMIGTPFYEIPPPGYGGLEAIVASLVDGLSARGHEVTLFGAGRGSRTDAAFVSTTREPQTERLGLAEPILIHAARVDRLLAGTTFDVIHDHSPAGPLTAAHRNAPTVVTAHGPTDGELGDFYADLGTAIDLVAISDAQRKHRPDLNWAGTVHNGVDPTQFVAAHRPDGPVLWLARFTPDKGPDLAITACRAANLPLVLAGKCNEPPEQEYFDETIRPMLGDDIRPVLNADRETTTELLTEARCLIVPIRWEEPFGMVMIEAMASGTPVVALRRGAVPEIVEDGRTGWICDDPDELPDALKRVAELDPADCEARVREHFTADIAAERYEHIYQQVSRRRSAR